MLQFQSLFFVTWRRMSEHYKTVTQFEMMNEGNVNFVICHENYKLEARRSCINAKLKYSIVLTYDKRLGKVNSNILIVKIKIMGRKTLTRTFSLTILMLWWHWWVSITSFKPNFERNTSGHFTFPLATLTADKTTVLAASQPQLHLINFSSQMI